jgi:plastocyanin
MHLNTSANQIRFADVSTNMKITGSLIVCTSAAAFTAALLLINPDPSPAKSGQVSEYGAPAQTTPAQITISEFTFSTVTVSPGARVEVKNLDGFEHTATSADGAFDTGSLAGGATATVTAPTAAGDYAFICQIHPSMKGVLTVA